MRQKIFKALEEAVEYAFSQQIENDILLVPPGVDDPPDQEMFDDAPEEVEMVVSDSEDCV